MFRKSLLLGIISGLLAGLVSLAYGKVYLATVEDDFFKVAKPAAIIASSLIGGILAAIGFWAISRLLKQRAEIVFNLLFVVLSFATTLEAFGAKLPPVFQAPETFPGMVIPMHFFPALAWFTLKPLFFPQKAV